MAALAIALASDTTAIDAVNLYNDERGACRPE
jgi:hypothetical protein